MLDIDFSDGFFMLPLRLVQLVCALIGIFPLVAAEEVNEFSVGLRYRRTRVPSSFFLSYWSSNYLAYCCTSSWRLGMLTVGDRASGVSGIFDLHVPCIQTQQTTSYD